MRTCHWTKLFFIFFRPLFNISHDDMRFCTNRWSSAALFLLFGVWTLISQLGCSRAPSAAEVSAKAELGKLGALVVMDSDRAHVAGVNLATLQAPEKIAEAVKLLPALTQINSLNAEGTGIGDGDMAEIAKLTSLRDLVLSHTKITDSEFEKLQSLKNLQALHVADTAITNASISTVGRLTSLAVLDLSGTKITGNFTPLQNLAKLNWLVLRNLSLDAAALTSLSDCKSLRRLSLNDTKCPPEAVETLRKERPDLSIDQ